MAKVSHRSIAEKFRRCGVGSKFWVTVGPIYERKVPHPQAGTICVERTFHTKYELNFEVSLDGESRRPTKRFLNYDIRTGLWIYGKEEKRGIFTRSEPRVVTHIEVVHCVEEN